MSEAEQVAKPAWGKWILIAVLALMLGLTLLLWQRQGQKQAATGPAPDTATMAQQLAAIAHPAGTASVKQIAEAGATEGDPDCPPWYLAGESRTFTGSRDAIRAFYTEPYQMIFFDEMKPMEPGDPFVILGHSPAEWGIGGDQIGAAYIVYHLVPTNCVGGEAHHHE